MDGDIFSELAWRLGLCLVLTTLFVVLLFRTHPPRTTGIVFGSIYLTALITISSKYGILLVPVILISALWLWMTLWIRAQPLRIGLTASSLGMLLSYLWLWSRLLLLYQA